MFTLKNKHAAAYTLNIKYMMCVVSKNYNIKIQTCAYQINWFIASWLREYIRNMITFVMFTIILNNCWNCIPYIIIIKLISGIQQLGSDTCHWYCLFHQYTLQTSLLLSLRKSTTSLHTTNLSIVKLSYTYTMIFSIVILRKTKASLRTMNPSIVKLWAINNVKNHKIITICTYCE